MAKRKSSGWFRWILLLLLVGGGFAGWRWYSNRPKDEAPDYKTNAVSRGDIVQQVTANGQISPVKNVAVGTQVSGIIDEVFVDFNSRVTNGQVIAQIDPSTYKQNITQSEAELANAQAALEYAQINMRRARDLKAAELIPASEFDKTSADLHQAEAVVHMREAALKRANVDLERTTIYAPIDGMVISRNVDKGQTVAASFNTPTLFQIANDLRNMQIDAMVSEADVGGVEEGQQVRFTVDAFPNRQFRGTVRQVRFAPSTNQNVVNYTTVVSVNNSDLKLRPGMTANASIITAQRSGVLRVPNASLRFRPPENAVAKGATNAPGRRSRSTNQNTMTTSDGTNSLPFPPPGDGPRPSREEMRQRFENMTPEQREQFRAMMRARSGDGGSGGMGSGSRPRDDGPGPRTVYVVDKEATGSSDQPVLKPVTVKTGISDGTFTEIVEGLQEGDVVVTGLNLPATAAATAARPPGGSPFGGPFGGGGFRPR
jgi:HlyD family secretion protein